MRVLDRSVERVKLPLEFLRWQCEERCTLFEALGRGQYPRFLASHLPVVSCLNGAAETFPIHSATKGVGLLPRRELIHEHVEEINDTLARCRDRDPKESLGDRIKAAQSLYERPERIDRRLLGAIEIFRGQTYRNLCRDPRVTLLYTGSAPRYLSYQVNCAAETVAADDLRFQFILGMRFLFEVERFHIQQPEYPLGYVFRVQEVFEKTPRMGRAGKRVEVRAAGED